jgi:capsular exopolysaccharide synthesis family protein
MSRVFDALTKAGEQKRQQPIESAETKSSESVEEIGHYLGSATTKANGINNGRVVELPYAARASDADSKSWRERIEEWFFGWDLRRYNNYPIVALEKDSPAAEQYKILREQIKRLRSESGLRTFSITSPVKRDGKTTVAVNLAAVLALDYEEKVLLIDGDLRAPGVHRYFNVSASPGLADYLSSSSSRGIKSYVQETFLSSLKILPAGKPSDLASELLAKEKMKHVLEEIWSEFPGHQIIIDCPPILSTPDPMVVARQVDGVLMVVRAGKTPRDFLMKSLQSLNSSKVMGIVLNGADLGMASKYYYYSSTNAG